MLALSQVALLLWCAVQSSCLATESAWVEACQTDLVYKDDVLRMGLVGRPRLEPADHLPRLHVECCSR